MAAVASSRHRLRRWHGRGRVTGQPQRQPHIWRRLATLGLLVALAVALLLAVPALSGVREEISHINLRFLAVAVAVELASDVGFVVLFRLFFDRLPARDARLLAWTEEASGVLLPGGGAGGLAIGGWLIHLTGVPTAWIVRRSGALLVGPCGERTDGYTLARPGACPRPVRCGDRVVAGFVPSQAPVGTHPSTVSSQTATGLEVTFLIMLAALVAGGFFLARARAFYASDVATAAASEQAEVGR